MSHLERFSIQECRYEYLSPSELLARLQARAVLYLPIGSLEWHNEHLPLGTDTFHAITLAHRLCGALGGVVLPAFWWNTGGCHRHPSTFYMKEQVYRQTLKNVLSGLAYIPARMVVLINGHGGGYQKDSIQAIADELNSERFPMRVLAADPYGLGTASHCRIDHADTGETSAALELIPQLVRLNRPIGPDIVPGRITNTEKGPPSQEAGRELWEAFFQDAVSLIEREYWAAR